MSDLDEVRLALAREAGPLTPQRVATALRASGRPVGDLDVLAVHEELRRELLGAGVLEPLLRDETVTDVLVNGIEGVFVDRGHGLERCGVTFTSEEEVRRLAQRLASAAGRRIDDATPYCDVRLRDGTRFHAVLAPMARPGTAISLRVPRHRPFTLADLVRVGTLTDAGARLVADLLEQRLAFLISGGTGTGKTTLLATLLGLVPATERIVIVEDASELRPEHPHVVALEGRPANLEGVGAVELRTLVRQSLRMRPDRLVVGEVRGAEVVDLLAALNTGHEGGCGTIHANTASAVPHRIEALALAAGLGRDAVHSQLAAALDVVLHVTRGADGRRRLGEVAVPLVTANGLVVMEPAVTFDHGGRGREGPGANRLAELLQGGRR